jgi:hypothetical protein
MTPIEEVKAVMRELQTAKAGHDGAAKGLAEWLALAKKRVGELDAMRREQAKLNRASRELLDALREVFKRTDDALRRAREVLDRLEGRWPTETEADPDDPADFWKQ